MKLAVILPVYQGEKGLERTLNSLIEQTFKDLEIWIVNDGSTDKTAVIAEEFAKKYNYIHVIHQTNQRIYQARLNALRKINTPYFTFIDADDTLEPNTYQEVIQFIETYNLDIAQFDLHDRTQKKEPYTLFLTPQDIKKKVINPMLVDGYPLPYLCNKIYRNHYDFSTFKNINLLTFEDMIMNLQLFYNVKRVGYLNKPFYHYNISMASSVSNFSTQKLNDFILAMRLRPQLLEQYYQINPNSASLYQWVIRNARVALILAATAPNLYFHERIRLLNEILLLPEVRLACRKCFTLKKIYPSLYLLSFARYFPRTTILLLKPIRWVWKKLPLLIREKA